MLEQRASFHGLKYFPENPALQFRLSLDQNVPKDFVMLPTSTGAQQRYERAGKVQFQVDGQPATLTVFKDASGYFVPFRDTTSETETYGAGRYLEPEMEGDQLRVDFNYAYNPYCAYNEEYSCPIPPRENWLPVPIAAGEKRFH